MVGRLKELRHLHYFERLLAEPDNELVQQAQAEGMLAVGYACAQVPPVLLALDRCFPVRLRGGENGFLDGVAALADAPTKLAEHTLRRYVRQLREMLRDMAAERGADVSDAALCAAVAERNELSRVLREIGALRTADNAPVTGYEFAVLNGISEACPARLILPKLRETLREIRRREPGEKPWYRARVAVVSGNAEPSVIREIEAAGVFAAADCAFCAPGRGEIVLRDGEDILTQIALHSMKASLCPRYADGDKTRQRRETVDALARQARADGIVFAQSPCCDAWALACALESHVMREDYGWSVLTVGGHDDARRLGAFVERLADERGRREKEAAEHG